MWNCHNTQQCNVVRQSNSCVVVSGRIWWKGLSPSLPFQVVGTLFHAGWGILRNKHFNMQLLRWSSKSINSISRLCTGWSDSDKQKWRRVELSLLNTERQIMKSFNNFSTSEHRFLKKKKIKKYILFCSVYKIFAPQEVMIIIDNARTEIRPWLTSWPCPYICSQTQRWMLLEWYNTKLLTDVLFNTEVYRYQIDTSSIANCPVQSAVNEYYAHLCTGQM